MHWLEYFFDTPSLASKPPYLVLQLSPAAFLAQLSTEDILAAALFFEYRLAGWRTRIFSTDDAVGFRTIIAFPAERTALAERASRALLHRGALLVLTTYEPGEEEVNHPPHVQGALLGYRERHVRRLLTLGPTYEDTLARMGRLTRRNLRYYRRKLESQLNISFVEDASAHLSFEEFKVLNGASLNPVRSEKELRLRWRSSCELPGGFCAGIRADDGRWLSLVGGWRHDTTTVLHWQLNSAGFEQHSIGTVMRSFFLENQIARGTRKLLMFGGTPHSIRYSFDQDTIADLLVCRPTVRMSLLLLLARELMKHSLRARKNHLLQTIASVPLRAWPPMLPESPPAINQTAPQNSRAA